MVRYSLSFSSVCLISSKWIFKYSPSSPLIFPEIDRENHREKKKNRKKNESEGVIILLEVSSRVSGCGKLCLSLFPSKYQVDSSIYSSALSPKAALTNFSFLSHTQIFPENFPFPFPFPFPLSLFPLSDWAVLSIPHSSAFLSRLHLLTLFTNFPGNFFSIPRGFSLYGDYCCKPH